MRVKLAIVFIFLIGFTTSAKTDSDDTYAPAKVVYDVSTPEASVLGHILDRISLLQNIYGSDPFEASIIVVVHEGAIPLFAKSSQNQAVKLMQRASSLAVGEIIQFRICKASAKMQGFTEKDFPEFTTLVPMADAEIIKLQHEGYAYLR